MRRRSLRTYANWRELKVAVYSDSILQNPSSATFSYSEKESFLFFILFFLQLMLTNAITAEFNAVKKGKKKKSGAKVP